LSCIIAHVCILFGLFHASPTPRRPPFHVPEEVRALFRRSLARGAEQEAVWRENLEVFRSRHPEAYQEFEEITQGRMKEGWEETIKKK
jgi:transketolase